MLQGIPETPLLTAKAFEENEVDETTYSLLSVLL